MDAHIGLATRTRSEAANGVPQWSVAIRERVSPAERPRRIVATNVQLAILRTLYARSGQDPTKDDIDEVVRETGLEAKWVRKWIKRQRGNARRKSGDSNARSASAKSTVLGLPSPEEEAVATLPPPVPQAQVVASVPPPHRHSPAYSAAGASPAAHSGALEKLNATAVSGSYPAAYYTASPVPAARPAAFQQLSGYYPPAGDTSFHSDDDFSSGAAYTYAAGPSSAAVYLPSASPMDSLAGQPGLPASLISVPLHPDDPLAYETYPGAPSASLPQGHIALNALSPVFPLDYADPVYASTTEELQSSVEAANALLSPGFPATIAPAELSIPTFVPPTGLTASAAYLYEIFHDSTATSEAAPPNAPTSDSVLFLPELTRPSDAAPPDLRAPLSAFASPTPTSQVYPGAPYPLSYQMRLTDLMALTKAIRHASAPPAAEHTRTHGRETDATMGAGHDGRAERADLDGAQLQCPSTTVFPVLQDDDARHAPAGVSRLMSTASMEDGDETEDEAEVVTPCEETNFEFSFGLRANAAKKALDGTVGCMGAGRVEVADATMDD